MREDPKDEQAPLAENPETNVRDDEPTLNEYEVETVPSTADELTETAAESSLGESDLKGAAVAETTAESSALPTPSDAPSDTTATPAATDTPVLNEQQPVIVSAVEPPKKKNKGILIGAIVAGALALLIGGGAAAYNLWYQNPQKVVGDAIVNAITAKTVQATGSLEIETDEYTLKIEASTKTTVDADGQVGIKLTYKADEFAVSVDGEGIYSSEGDIYVKVNDLKALVAQIEEQSDGQLDFAMFDGVIAKVDSKWVKIGKEDLGEFSEEYEKSQKCVADISKQLDEDASFQRSVEAEIKTLYQENQFIIVGDKIGSRDINGQGSLGYKLSADAEVADAFFTGLADTELGSRLQECNKDIKFDEIVSDEAKKDDGTETQAEIWVSRFGHSITEVSLTADEDGTKGKILVNPVFNKEESVEIPTDVITLTELQTDIEKAVEEYYSEIYGSYYSAETSAVEFN